MLLQHYNTSGTLLQLYSFFNYPQFDPSPFLYLMEVLEREGVTKEAVPLPFACEWPLQAS